MNLTRREVFAAAAGILAAPAVPDSAGTADDWPAWTDAVGILDTPEDPAGPRMFGLPFLGETAGYGNWREEGGEGHG